MQCEGGSGTFSVPSGASTGTHEAVELRDGDQSRWGGKGVLKAATNVQVNIAGALTGMDAQYQETLDRRMIELDGTLTKSRLGSNAIVGVSIAAAKAVASAKGAPLYEYLRELAGDVKPSRRVPFLCMNLTNGGKHASGKLAFQEYKIVPQTDDIREALDMGTALMHALQKAYVKQYGAPSGNIGDEGGFVPDVEDVRAPLEIFMQVAADLRLDHRIKLALDVAASSFFANDQYTYNGAAHTTAELGEAFRGIIRDFPMLYIEDPFHEEAFDDFATLNEALRQAQGDQAPLVVGDDLTTTNPVRLKQAVDTRAISGVIIKPNQIGTLTEMFQTMRMARANDIECIISHRSGETNDDFIADLAIATGAFGIKAGGPQRGERIAKYNRFLELRP